GLRDRYRGTQTRAQHGLLAFRRCPHGPDLVRARDSPGCRTTRSEGLDTAAQPVERLHPGEIHDGAITAKWPGAQRLESGTSRGPRGRRIDDEQRVMLTT